MNRYTKPIHNNITTPAMRRKRLTQHNDMKRVSTISTLIIFDEIYPVPITFETRNPFTKV